MFTPHTLMDEQVMAYPIRASGAAERPESEGAAAYRANTRYAGPCGGRNLCPGRASKRPDFVCALSVSGLHAVAGSPLVGESLNCAVPARDAELTHLRCR